MSYVNKLFETNFLEYASYVIKDRAIPHIDDGLKPVQRRILHSLFEMDDGKFNKVANVVGHCMKYHPHGDASIFSALVVLANKELFIDKQGNFGNIFTGDEASAARYIECRLLPMARETLYNPEITLYDDSYDGRNREPVTFPAKIPVILVQGAEGIAVGMSTKILPHNFNEVLDALANAIKGKKSKLYPDFPTGGEVDVSDYQDGMGKVLVRAKLDTSDPKRIVIQEIPFGTTTEGLMNSIENAARKNKIKIQSISDFTTENVEIEIKLARGVHTQDVVDALFAFTDCESSISVNSLLIIDGKPVHVTVSDIIQHHAKQLVEVLTKELKLEEQKLRDKLHARTLEQIFIEERIYKKIEQMPTHARVFSAVYKGFEPFQKQIKRKITDEDIERLLKIPIRRISLYDINKAKKEMEEINARLKEIKAHLANIKGYAVDFLTNLKNKYGKNYERQTTIKSFDRVDVREAATRDLKLRYNGESGYLGFGVPSGDVLCEVSHYDRILVIRKSGTYSVIKAPEKLFVDKGMLYAGLADKEDLAKITFTVLYKNKDDDYIYIKRTQIEKYILDKGYSLIPDNGKLITLTTETAGRFDMVYKPKPRLKKLEESFEIKDYLVKSVKANGVRVTNKELKSLKFVVKKRKPKKK